MYEIDFTHPGKIHFIGIGGISMSGFAELLHSMGFTITGSDWHESKITKHLESLGIQVVYGQKEENITKDIDLVVYTAAVKKTNPEYQAAEKLNLPLMERAVVVGQVMKNYSSAIAIAEHTEKQRPLRLLPTSFWQQTLTRQFPSAVF